MVTMDSVWSLFGSRPPSRVQQLLGPSYIPAVRTMFLLPNQSQKWLVSPHSTLSEVNIGLDPLERPNTRASSAAVIFGRLSYFAQACGQLP